MNLDASKSPKELRRKDNNEPFDWFEVINADDEDVVYWRSYDERRRRYACDVDNPSVDATKNEHKKFLKAKQVLVDNGIAPDEASTVLEALLCTLDVDFNEDELWKE